MVSPHDSVAYRFNSHFAAVISVRRDFVVASIGALEQVDASIVLEISRLTSTTQDFSIRCDTPLPHFTASPTATGFATLWRISKQDTIGHGTT
jgi:hypothetical protein